MGSDPGVTLVSDRVTYGPQPPAFRDDSRLLASFRQGRALTIWRTGSWEVARTWNISGAGNALAFAPEGSRLAVASDGEAAIWDADTGEKVGELRDARLLGNGADRLESGRRARGHIGGRRGPPLLELRDPAPCLALRAGYRTRLAPRRTGRPRDGSKGLWNGWSPGVSASVSFRTGP